MADDPLRRLTDAVADVTEEEVTALLSALGLRRGREVPAEVLRTPLPGPGEPAAVQIRSDVEWV
ncbi:hypothetical protein [Streptomyces sp. JW3]|uniref:hypothetical protein n=1 Tax=Streptomyces sp. JW3 TaxID=3456955 RepID=UPI003FA4638F